MNTKKFVAAIALLLCAMSAALAQSAIRQAQSLAARDRFTRRRKDTEAGSMPTSLTTATVTSPRLAIVEAGSNSSIDVAYCRREA